MAYTIYILSEDLMSISGSAQGLDGVNQGDGSHMVGRTITLNSGAWQPVSINDDDSDFRDNDSGQTLAGPTTIGAESFSGGTRVEAEYSITITDGTSTWTVIGFNVNNSGPSYATIEGLAFIGPVGGFPPVGVPLTVTAAQEGPNFQTASYATPVCFVAGTRVAVPGGVRAIETLRPGDAVITRDHGPQPLRWIGQRTVRAEGRFAPILFRPGALGNDRALRVSRQHRMRLGGWKAELMFGEAAVLIPAVHFVDGRDVVIEKGGWVTYVHLLFDAHQIVFAEGVEAESFHPAQGNLDRLSAASRAELLALFPELERGTGYGPLAHPPLTRREAQALLAA
jgi:hypothetical protein